MKYMGSKMRIWKDIAPFILEKRKEGQCYVEPFCGGCNSLSNVNGWRLAADINPYLIAMFRSLLNNEPQYFPIEKELYKNAYNAYKCSERNKFSQSDLGWIGFMASYNGKFFNGYSGVSHGRNYVFESMRNILNQLDSLRGVKFYCCSYNELVIPKKSIIYCDIPYKGTTKYQDDFNHDKFYQWCFDKKSEGHRVYISEYWMPDDFDCIWSKKISNSLDRYSEQKAYKTERLFTIK